MKPLWIAVFLGCAATLLAAEKPGEKGKSDAELIQGEWKVVSWQEGGNPAKDSNFPFTQLEFTSDKLKLWGVADGKLALGGIMQYKVDASKTPKTMYTTHELEKGKPIVQLAAYSLEGDEVKLALASAGRPYPTKVRPGDWSYLVLKREKKTEK